MECHTTEMLKGVESENMEENIFFQPHGIVAWFLLMRLYDCFMHGVIKVHIRPTGAEQTHSHSLSKTRDKLRII